MGKARDRRERRRNRKFNPGIVVIAIIAVIALFLAGHFIPVFEDAVAGNGPHYTNTPHRQRGTPTHETEYEEEATETPQPKEAATDTDTERDTDSDKKEVQANTAETVVANEDSCKWCEIADAFMALFERLVVAEEQETNYMATQVGE
jgi:hypothetical protein